MKKLLLPACNFIEKDTSSHVFYCQLSQSFKNTYFVEHLQTVVSALQADADANISLDSINS